MRKVLIFGNSGSGKTTLARQLVKADGLAHLDLDELAWLNTDPPQRRPLNDAGEEILAFIRANRGWVIEGCYTDMLQVAKAYANEAFFLNLPVQRCVENARKRPWEPHKYDSKAAQDSNLEMLLEWIARYYQRDDTFSQKAHLAFYKNFAGKKTLLETT